MAGAQADRLAVTTRSGRAPACLSSWVWPPESGAGGGSLSLHRDLVTGAVGVPGGWPRWCDGEPLLRAMRSHRRQLGAARVPTHRRSSHSASSVNREEVTGDHRGAGFPVI